MSSRAVFCFVTSLLSVPGTWYTWPFMGLADCLTLPASRTLWGGAILAGVGVGVGSYSGHVGGIHNTEICTCLQSFKN